MNTLRRILLALGFSLCAIAAVFAQAGGLVGMAVTGAGTGTTGAVTGTLTAVAGKTLYICGFDVSAIGGTADVGPITVAGLAPATTSFVYHIASSAGGVTLPRRYTPCLPAATPTTNITVTTTADGTATAVDVNVWGVAQ